MATINSSPPSPIQSRIKRNIVLVHDQPKFDLESYLANYQGRTRVERLLFIGASSTVLGVEALKLAIKEAKKGKDVNRYLQAQNTLRVVGPFEPEASRDLPWVEKQGKINQAETTRLEAELKGYKNNLIKESIRMGHEDLGKHYQAIGDLHKAFEAYTRMRQDISMAKQIVDVSKHLIEVSIEQRNYVAVASNLQKIQGTLGSPDDDRSLQPFLCTAQGLCHLDAADYYSAARKFLSVEAGMGSSCSTFISPNDVAVYGGLCALATMDRNELQTKVLENSNFRTYLELEPHIRRAISSFVNGRYTACLEVLEAYRSDYLLDLHLQKHIDELHQLVRTKSIVQYFVPFSCVTLESLDAAFAAPGKTIEKELVAMITKKELDARIDTQNRLLTSLPSAPRSSLHNLALETAKEYERETRLRIQHMNIQGADLEIKGNKRNVAFNSGLDNDFFDGGFGRGRDLRSGRNA
ncbi:26S proteasome subunit RPN7 [Drepanopeziza brunnea f. sp. 'multigermtubi' MB_m1]|uniref:COP9 signalosome complex subunit 1 n=1 Tax=Marssonina brunnea f. sp. multigermtubi (strain MB_m1) TaxID=1072389 RepID=K1X5X7_MARBU|nr:26S proteasome subunit RPN7 [Drepanopeziza brunnea f. sp. 'multigermtubi' MB_m1]EKD20537.1 26S proteasome subunit RPN7 [Drepanopeziza brunnea f. sp. 'multigermtubi' MB_m1]